MPFNFEIDFGITCTGFNDFIPGLFQHGKKVCSVVKCPRLECSNPQPYPGECCPQCPGTITYVLFFYVELANPHLGNATH